MKESPPWRQWGAGGDRTSCLSDATQKTLKLWPVLFIKAGLEATDDFPADSKALFKMFLKRLTSQEVARF